MGSEFLTLNQFSYSTFYDNYISSPDDLSESLLSTTRSDEGTEFGGGEFILHETTDMALQFTYEVWVKGTL